MPNMDAPLKLGINDWNQYADWDSFLAAQQRADRLGFDSIWTWDHLYPIVGSHEGPIFECYTAMAAVASLTTHASIGMMVGANTFRNPALVAKMITTLDHISGGRAVLGIGAAWFETEHRA
ncbi:MAG TPA: LLM class flavin-dependent oxidoreductase, partial [Anaerolineae bacterium]|nr:LLM class flavin-dependent oxidoreductase [Anaerolineae bacterium]